MGFVYKKRFHMEVLYQNKSSLNTKINSKSFIKRILKLCYILLNMQMKSQNSKLIGKVNESSYNNVL